MSNFVKQQIPNKGIDTPPNDTLRDYLTTSLALFDALSKVQVLDTRMLIPRESPTFALQYDPAQDFKWFASGEVDTSSYKGQYIAIWMKRIVGSGATAVEAERVAKAHYEDSRPAVVYIPEDEDAIL